MAITSTAQIPGKVALAGTLLLILLIVIINIAGPAFNILLLLAQLLPLALTINGQLRGNPKTYQWLCFADLFYMTQGILLAFTPGSLVLGLLETVVSLIIFVSAIIFIRASIKNRQHALANMD